MQAEIITIGDELLIGQVIDTNSVWLGQLLFKNNISVFKKTAIKDLESEIVAQLDLSLAQSDFIVITGGLGPTKDDITKITLAKYFKMGWRVDVEVLKQLETFFADRGRVMMEANKMQAELPSGCETLGNEWGTAPGMLFRVGEKIIVSLPGVPLEMKNIFEQKVMPIILEHFELPKLHYKTLVTFNIPESLLAKQIEDIENDLPQNIGLAYLPNFNIVRLRLTGKEEHGVNIEQQIDGFAKRLTERIGDAVLAETDQSLVEIAADLLKLKNKTLSIAESCTGGYLSHIITSLSGSSSFFVGSVISYSNSVKHHQLGVESTLFETVGAVSEPVVEQMCSGVRERLQTDYAIAISGIAGPDGGSAEKPVGTVVIGISNSEQHFVKKYYFIGDRSGVISRASNMAMFLLIQELKKI